MPICLLHVCLILTNSRRGKAIPILYFIHGCLALTLYGNKFVADVQVTPYGYWTVGGPLFYVFLASYAVTTTWLMLAIYHRRRTASVTLRPGLTALLAGVICLWICGSNDLLPILGFNNYPFTTIHFFPMGKPCGEFLRRARGVQRPPARTAGRAHHHEQGGGAAGAAQLCVRDRRWYCCWRPGCWSRTRSRRSHL